LDRPLFQGRSAWLAGKKPPWDGVPPGLPVAGSFSKRTKKQQHKNI
jgi:hypothetical protein